MNTPQRYNWAGSSNNPSQEQRASMAAKMTKWFEWSIVIFAGALFAIVGFELSVDGFDSMGLGAHDIPLGILGGAAIGFWVATILYRMLKRRHPTAFTEQ